MTYLCHVPAPPLDTYINYIFYRDQPMPYPREKILPMPWLNLMINFGGAFRAYEPDTSQAFAVCKDSWWIGLWGAYHLIEWAADIQFFVVDFKPGGAYPFLRLPLSELNHQVVSLDTLWGQFAAELREQLYHAPTPAARFSLLERLLLERLHEPPYGFRTVQYALSQIASQQGALSIRTLSDQIGISQKHLISQFNQMVGGTPKQLARMIRFRHIMLSVDSCQSVDWTRVAHQAGYYDQSHFNKDFESFTGYIPSDYLRIRRQVQAENPSHAKILRQLPIG